MGTNKNLSHYDPDCKFQYYARDFGNDAYCVVESHPAEERTRNIDDWQEAKRRDQIPTPPESKDNLKRRNLMRNLTQGLMKNKVMTNLN